jgi:hypothetical protein
MKATITERGWIAYYICAERCRFRRNTLIEFGKRRVVVVSVGLFYAKPDDKEPDTVGHNRYYETCVFHAKRAGHYWDIDVNRPIYNYENPNQITTWKPLNSDQRANDMHEAIVCEITAKLERGETLK